MAVIRTATAAMAVALAAVWACGSAGVFACSDDSQCHDAGVTGTCESSGYCSFDDDACPSGRRYGSWAPPELVGQCVAPTDASTGVTADVTTATAASTADDGTTGSSSSSAPSTTTPVDPTASESVGEGTTATGPLGSSSSGAVDDGSSSTTDRPVPACEIAFLDHFDDGMIDPEWETWSSPGAYFAEENGHLMFSIPPSQFDWLSAGHNTGVHSLLGGHVRVELTPFSAPLEVVGLWLTLFDIGDCEVQIAVEDSVVLGYVDGVWLDGVAIDTEQPMWLQLRVEPDGFVHWEYSTDGDTWLELHGEAPACDFSAARSAIFAGDMHANRTPVIREIEWFERCAAP